MKVLILFSLFVSSLFAHKLNIFLFEENEKIVANTYFASGNACRNCKVEVFNEKGELLVTGTTNEKGNYIFGKLAKTLEVKVEANGGHAAKNKIEIKNIKKNKEELEKPNSLLQSLIAIVLIALIFIALKRFKK